MTIDMNEAQVRSVQQGHALDAPGLGRIVHFGGKQARTVQVQKRVEVLHAERQ